MKNWIQIGGDMSPSQYGAVIARRDGRSIELREIQPVREYMGDDEALEVGFPFWTKEAYYDPEDLDLKNPHVQLALQSFGLGLEELQDIRDPEMAIAECLLRYGHGVDEGPSGWAKDVVPGMVKWMSGKQAGWSYLADEDKEFRALQRGSRRR
jgi:hypothetical protein